MCDDEDDKLQCHPDFLGVPILHIPSIVHWIRIKHVTQLWLLRHEAKFLVQGAKQGKELRVGKAAFAMHRFI